MLSVINDYINKDNWKINENSNINYSLQGLYNRIVNSTVSKYWLDKIYGERIADLHRSGKIHIHDVGMLSTYCVGWDLYELLRNGFGGVEGKAWSRPPKHLDSALSQVVNFLYTLQQEAAGAQAFNNIDVLLAPFIAFDNLSREKLKQLLQGFIFNLNVPTRIGGQVPFINFTIDIYASASPYANMPVLIGGEPTGRTYKEFQDAVNLFNEVFFEVMSEGDAKESVFTFPIITVNITKGFDYNNPALNNMWKGVAKYGNCYFANFVNSDMDPNDAFSMCCRLRLSKKELRRRGGGLFGANNLTGSVGVVTINLPSVALESGGDKNKFFNILAERMEAAKDSLERKRTIIEDLTERGLYAYSRYWLKNVRKSKGGYWENHFSTIGLIGMHEACLNMFGSGIAENRNFALEVLKYMRQKLIYFQEETGHLYNLEASPAEGASYRLALKDRKYFGDFAHFSGEGDSIYYTNSSQLPVNYTGDMVEMLNHQDELQCQYTGGTVAHLWIGEKINSEQAKIIVKWVTERYNLPYISLTPTFSICPVHGYIFGEHFFCPTCHQACNVYSRVVGYYRPVSWWNKGKQEEFKNRKYFNT